MKAIIRVERLEDRDCPSGPADVYLARYRGLPDAELRQRAQDAAVRGEVLAREGMATRTRTGALEYGYDLLRATDRFMRLRDVNGEITAIQQIQRGRR